MKKYYSFFMLMLAVAALPSCNDDDDTVAPIQAAEVKTATDIPADVENKKRFTFYNLRDGQVMTSADSNSTRWDIAFRGTTILVNGGSSGPGQGGAQVVDGIFAELGQAPETGYRIDAAGAPAIPASSGASWYKYTANEAPQHAVIPIAGKVIMLRTADGKYAKVEILSYYKGNPNTASSEFASMATRPASKYYTFRYAVQPNGSKKF